MMNGFENIQKLQKENTELAMKSFGNVSKGFQAIAAEIADYSKKSFEDGTALVEQLAAAKSLDKAIELNGEYAKSAYEGFVGEASKIGEMYMDVAKEVYKPIETAVSKATAAK